MSLIGVGNVVGTFCAGVLAAKHERHKPRMLSALYGGRAALFAAMLLAPASAASVLCFAFVLGCLWLSTVPLTSGLVQDMFGPRYGTTLFAVAFASHQTGAFLGAWLGGKVLLLRLLLLLIII